MVAKYYYLRDEKNRPVITVCILRLDSGSIGKGVAICSPDDNTIKIDGRAKAGERALKAAVYAMSDMRVNRPSVVETILDLNDMKPIKYKSEYMPVLSEFEKQLIGGE